MQPLSRAELEALPAQRPAQDKRVCRDWDTGNLMTTPDWLRAKYPQQVTLEQARQECANYWTRCDRAGMLAWLLGLLSSCLRLVLAVLHAN